MYKNHLVFNYVRGTMLEVTMTKGVSPDSLLEASQDYVVDKNNVHFYMPDVEIPRFKRKVFADDNKMKNTNKLEKANCVIFNPYSSFAKFNDTETVRYDLSWFRVDIKEFIEHLKILAEYGYADSKTIKKTEILSKTNNYIYASSSSKTSFCKALSELANEYVNRDYFRYPFIVSQQLEDAYQANPSIKFITQKSIQQCISEDGIIIDVDKYKELTKLIDTNDEDNVTLAMEIIANSNYAKSIIYIFMILLKRGRKLYELGPTNHVNFMHMMHYFGMGNHDLGSDLDADDVEIVFRILKEHGQFTKRNAEMFLNFYNNESGQHFHEGITCNNNLRLNDNAELDEPDPTHVVVDETLETL